MDLEILNKPFEHIYIEESIKDNDYVKEILGHFKNSKIVIINHYKDVFNRSKQDYMIQHNSQNLILASKKGNLVYKGASVCQSFNNKYFYYTSCIMNCLYDCEYCYLKGMYPSANMVVFINIEDVFRQVEELLSKHSVYICVSYDTDLIAVESIFGMVKKWCNFAKSHDNLIIEVRTKCANKHIWDRLEPLENVIYAFTLSPKYVVESFEHRTSSLEKRIECISYLQEKGYKLRLCFDPMIYCNNWQYEYDSMLNDIYKKIDIDKNVIDISVGSFRISKDYLKKMRKNEKESIVVQFPYENINGVYQYPDKLMNSMESFLIKKLKEKVPQDKIFRWK